jgi:hypothetical protein
MADFDMRDDDSRSGVRIGLPMDGLDSGGSDSKEISAKNLQIRSDEVSRGKKHWQRS